MKRHKTIRNNEKIIDEIFKNLKNKNNLIVTLEKMIQESYESLLEEPEEDEEGNATWEVVDLSPKKSQK